MAEESLAEQKRKFWEALRTAIVHEDNLVNHRLTWLLNIEGFLLGGFFLVQNSLLSAKLAIRTVIAIESLLTIIFLGSIWICLISGYLIAAAYQQVALIQKAWVSKYPEERRDRRLPLHGWLLWGGPQVNEPQEEKTKHEFPPIMGEFEYPYRWSAQRIPLILLAINCFAIGACIAVGNVAFFGGTSSNRQNVKVELEKIGSGSKVTATFEMAQPPKDLWDEVKSVLQFKGAPQVKQP